MIDTIDIADPMDVIVGCAGELSGCAGAVASGTLGVRGKTGVVDPGTAVPSTPTNTSDNELSDASITTIGTRDGTAVFA